MDRKTMSKSAPAFRKRRASNKGEKKMATLRDVNQWVNRGNSDSGHRKNARNIGLLTENVTEERMLYARQIELGRERYKFLSSHTYERQKFVDRQNRKQKTIEKRVAYTKKQIEKSFHSDVPKTYLTVRIPQVDPSSGSTSPDKDEMPRLESRALSRGGQRTERSLVTPIPKSAPFRLQNKSKTFTGVLSTSTIVNARENVKNTETKKTEHKLPSVCSAYTRGLASVPSPRGSAFNSQSSVFGRNNLASNASSTWKPDTTAEIADDEVFLSWANKKRDQPGGNYGQKFDSSTADPRYVALTNTLIPLVNRGKSVLTVKDVIQRKDCLRRGSLYENATKVKQMHAKFIAMILEKELAITT